MCGRFTLTTPDLEGLADHLGASLSRVRTMPYRPRYNVAPTDPHWIVRRPSRDDLPLPGEEGWPGPQRVLVPARWGLVNFWAKDGKDAARRINARVEGLHGRPAFRQSVVRHRCLVPADGFLEWRKEGKQKQPLWFHRADGRPFVFAGLYDRWFPPEAGEGAVRGAEPGGQTGGQLTFTILTRGAGPEVRGVHDRMPVILPDDQPDLWEAWLGAADLARPEDLEHLLAAFEGARGPLIATAVSTRVGSVKNDDPECLAPLDATSTKPRRQLTLFE